MHVRRLLRSTSGAVGTALLLTTLTVVLAIVPLTANAQAHSGPMPDSRFYSLSFRHILSLYNDDAQAGLVDVQAANTSVSYTALDWYYRGRLGTTAKEEAAFLAEAQSWSAEVAPVDAQAHSIIAAIHARTPGGKLAPGEDPPAPPQILVTLQQQRDAITLKHVSHLRAAFGDARFTELDGMAHRAAHLTTRGSAPSPGTMGHNPMTSQGREDQ